MAIPDSAPMAVQTTSGVELQPVKSTAAAAGAGARAVIGKRNFIEIPVHFQIPGELSPHRGHNSGNLHRKAFSRGRAVAAEAPGGGSAARAPPLRPRAAPLKSYVVQKSRQMQETHRITHSTTHLKACAVTFRHIAGTSPHLRARPQGRGRLRLRPVAM